MANESTLAGRVDHFAAYREPQTSGDAALNRVESLLAHDKYHITPGLIETLTSYLDRTSRPPPLSATINDVLQGHARDAYTSGQRSIINALGQLMANQESQA